MNPTKQNMKIWDKDLLLLLSIQKLMHARPEVEVFTKNN